jgi:hypothetical protein
VRSFFSSFFSQTLERDRIPNLGALQKIHKKTLKRVHTTLFTRPIKKKKKKKEGCEREKDDHLPGAAWQQKKVRCKRYLGVFLLLLQLTFTFLADTGLEDYKTKVRQHLNP